MSDYHFNEKKGTYESTKDKEKYTIPNGKKKFGIGGFILVALILGLIIGAFSFISNFDFKEALGKYPKLESVNTTIEKDNIVEKSNGVKDTLKTEFKVAYESDEAYMESLKRKETLIMNKIFVEDAEEPNIIYYTSNLSRLNYIKDEIKTRVYPYLYSENGIIQMPSIHYVYEGYEPIGFDEIVVIIDGDEFRNLFDSSYKIVSSDGGYHFEEYYDWIDSDIGIARAAELSSAESVMVKFKITETTENDEEYLVIELSETEKIAFKEVIEAYQVLSGEFLYNFSADY